MKRLCGSVSRPGVKRLASSEPTERKTFSRDDAVVFPITLAAPPCRHHSHSETTKSVWMCAESTATVVAGGGHRDAIHHASSFQHGTQANVPPSPKTFLWRTVQILMCVCAAGTKEEEKHNEAHQNSKRHSCTAAIHAARPQPQQSRTVAAHTYKKRKKKKKEKHGGRVWLCVALRVSASPGRKRTRGKEMCAPPNRPSSHAHTSRLPQRAGRRGPSHACSRRGAQGRRHERVGGCASGAVGRE
ncbi:hypothetical protein MOQ_007386, partial [Trypanosoma cruzi marinkellei]